MSGAAAWLRTRLAQGPVSVARVAADCPFPALKLRQAASNMNLRHITDPATGAPMWALPSPAEARRADYLAAAWVGVAQALREHIERESHKCP